MTNQATTAPALHHDPETDAEAGAAVIRAVRHATTWLDQNNGHNPAEVQLRILKLIEEAGEVAQAVIGAAGQNPRKGVTHTTDDIARELLDVALAALVAFQSLRYVDVAAAVAVHAEKITARIGPVNTRN